MKDLKAGDKVIIKGWKDMINEFGLDKDGDINMSTTYFDAHNMRKYCGQTMTVNKIHYCGDDRKINLKEDKNNWQFTTEMFKLKLVDNNDEPAEYTNLFEILKERITNIEIVNNEYYDKNKLFFKLFDKGLNDNEDNAIKFTYLKKGNLIDEFYYDFLVAIEGGVPNAIPIPILQEYLGLTDIQCQKLMCVGVSFEDDYELCYRSYYDNANVYVK